MVGFWHETDLSRYTETVANSAAPPTELEADVRHWINEWNADPKPFIRTKTADQILDTD